MDKREGDARFEEFPVHTESTAVAAEFTLSVKPQVTSASFLHTVGGRMYTAERGSSKEEQGGAIFRSNQQKKKLFYSGKLYCRQTHQYRFCE